MTGGNFIAGFFVGKAAAGFAKRMKKNSHNPKPEAWFITFEGIDGSGKSTQAMLTYRFLSSKGYKVNLLREPGSTRVSEKIRKILLDKRNLMGDRTELLLYEAARAEICSREILPLLTKGEVVLCDRFYDSTTAYQGYGRKLDLREVRALHRVATGGLVPDLTFLCNINLQTAFKRRSAKLDRLESESMAFFERVRKGFLEIARKERRRVKVVDASQPIDIVFEQIKKTLCRKLKIDDSRQTFV